MLLWVSFMVLTAAQKVNIRMFLLLVETLYIIWCTYVLIQSEGTWKKILLSLLILFVGVVKGFCFICFLVSDIFAIGIIIMCLQLMIISCYRQKYNNRWQIICGLTLFAGLSIFKYYHGSVAGEMEFRISDLGGLAWVGSYELYRCATYASDVVFPFSLIFNLIISPFWLRNEKAKEETNEETNEEKE